MSFPGAAILRRIDRLLPWGRSARLFAAFVALGAILVPATAQANFTSPVFLSESFQNSEEPQVAISGSGVGLASWERFDGSNFRVQIRSRSATGVLGSVQTLSAAGADAFSSQVALNATGTGIIAWTRTDVAGNDRIQAVTRSSTGVLGTVQTLSDPLQNAESPQVAIDSNGNAIVVWERSDGVNTRIQEVQISAAGVVGSVQTLSDGGADAFSPQVAVGGNGNALVVWTRFQSACSCDKIQARTVSAAGVVGSSIQGLAPSTFGNESPQVGIDANGNAVVVWVASDGSNDRIQGRTRSASGVLGSVKDLSASGQDSFAPQVAVNATGAGLVDWSFTGPFCGCDRVQGVPFSSGGAVGTVQILSSVGEFDEEPQVGIDANGNGVVVWESFKGSQENVLGRTRSAAGGLGSIQGLAPSTFGNESPQVGIDANGNGVVVWESFKGSQENVLGRTRSAAGGLGSIQKLSTSGLAFSPQVAMNGVGNALAVWTRTGTFDRIQASAGP